MRPKASTRHVACQCVFPCAPAPSRGRPAGAGPGALDGGSPRATDAERRRGVESAATAPAAPVQSCVGPAASAAFSRPAGSTRDRACVGAPPTSCVGASPMAAPGQGRTGRRAPEPSSNRPIPVRATPVPGAHQASRACVEAAPIACVGASPKHASGLGTGPAASPNAYELPRFARRSCRAGSVGAPAPRAYELPRNARRSSSAQRVGAAPTNRPLLQSIPQLPRRHGFHDMALMTDMAETSSGRAGRKED